jgi:cytidine deaminase
MEDELYIAAREFLEKRFSQDVPWVGACAVRLSNGEILTSTGFQEIPNEAARLCHETGAICEAYNRNHAITDFLCISRNDKLEYEILPPCGICQERLFYWGPNISIAVPSLPSTTNWHYVPLDKVQPYYWYKPYDKNA